VATGKTEKSPVIEIETGKRYSVDKLIIQTTSVGCNNNAEANFTFPQAFPNKCIVAIPFCGQFGFGARDTISIGNITVSGGTVYQRNNLEAWMTVAIFAIGY
jgi:hypothetical protein